MVKEFVERCVALSRDCLPACSCCSLCFSCGVVRKEGDADQNSMQTSMFWHALDRAMWLPPDCEDAAAATACLDARRSNSLSFNLIALSSMQ